jgi:hypothetical protein
VLLLDTLVQLPKVIDLIGFEQDAGMRQFASCRVPNYNQAL